MPFILLLQLPRYTCLGDYSVEFYSSWDKLIWESYQNPTEMFTYRLFTDIFINFDTVKL